MACCPALKMETACFSETLICTFEPIGQHDQEVQHGQNASNTVIPGELNKLHIPLLYSTLTSDEISDK
jgi:hypothetical protein